VQNYAVIANNWFKEILQKLFEAFKLYFLQENEHV